MASNRFIYFIISAFMAGNLLLVFLQYNSAKNIHSLITGNEKLLNELRVSNQLRELERDMLSVEIKIRGAIITNDTVYLQGADAQISETQRYLHLLSTISDHDSTLNNIKQLSEIANQKVILKRLLLDSFKATGNISTQRFKKIIEGKMLPLDKVNTISRKVFDSRQRLLDSLSRSTSSSGRKARTWGTVLIVVVLFGWAIIFWYIIGRIRQQNDLILQLDASEKKLRQASLIKENFMANMSHEIRTPMHVVLGFADLLQHKNKDPQLAEFIHSIRAAGKNLLAVINDILDLSKIEAGMMRIESAPFSIRELIHAVKTMFIGEAGKKGLQFVAEVDDAVPDTLSGDATRLTQILVNIAGNAVKFTPTGTININVRNLGADGDYTRLEFVVADTGIGIAKEKLPGLFERFRQAEDSITRKYGGSGLGLSIAKDLVLLQNGEITVATEVGIGSTFRFTIPYKPVERLAHFPALDDAGIVDYCAPANIRILIVDDNEMNQNLLKHLLGDWKLAFGQARSGSEALAKLEGDDYDLVLMDIQMPGMDGYTATQAIRSNLKLQTPIIAMTAHAFAGEREKCLGYGMDEYISKPINTEELYRLIIQFTGSAAGGAGPKKSSQQENAEIRQYEVINLHYMEDVSNGNKEYEILVAGQFIEAVPSNIAALEAAFLARDETKLRQTAHNMKTNVSVMGLLEGLQPYLDELEYEPFDELKFMQAISAIKTVCLAALPEARHFYNTLAGRAVATQ
jgi:signal transduction histidine kinase/CheY-like chemotaxis protein